MDKKELCSFSRGLPSPEELFHADEWKKYGQEEKLTRERIELLEETEAEEEIREKIELLEATEEEQWDEDELNEIDDPEYLECTEDIKIVSQQKEAEAMREQVLKEEPVPKRKKAKLFTAGFIIALLVLALILTNLEIFHLHLFCMMSESMGDVIPKGSVIVSYEAPAEKLKNGDVITYMNRDGVLITHEIVKVIDNYDGNGDYAFRTKGAANETEDEEAVTYGMVKGKALIYIPYIGKPFVK